MCQLTDNCLQFCSTACPCHVSCSMPSHHITLLHAVSLLSRCHLISIAPLGPVQLACLLMAACRSTCHIQAQHVFWYCHSHSPVQTPDCHAGTEQLPAEALGLYSALLHRIRPAHFVPVVLRQVKDAKSHADCLSALQYLSMLCSSPSVSSSAFSRLTCMSCICFDSTDTLQKQQAASATCVCHLKTVQR